MKHVYQPAWPSRHSQSGIVLIVALIMLAVIAMTSTAAMRLALSGDMVASNLRSNNLAEQAAEAGLRFCESALMNGLVPAASILEDVAPGGTPPWQDLTNWAGNTVINVPQAVLAGINGQRMPYTALPQCVVQRKELSMTAMNDDARKQMKDLFGSYLVTVRAFSPGFSRTAGQAVGGEVWMQSLLYIPFTQN